MVRTLISDLKLNYVQVIVPLAVICLVFVACVRQPSQSGQALVSGTTANTNCAAENLRIERLNDDCLREIFNLMPLTKLISIFPPSNPSIQTYVSRLVTGYWPQWVLDDIKKEKGEKNYAKRLVSYYYAFLKFPSLLQQKFEDQRYNESKSRIIGDPELIVRNPGAHIFGTFGDDKLIYYNNKVEDASGKIADDKYFTLVDLKTGKIIAKIKDTFTNELVHKVYGTRIHDLGNGTFALVLDYYSSGTNCRYLHSMEIMVLEWVSSSTSHFSGLNLVYRVDGPKARWETSYLGHVADKLVTWRQIEVDYQNFDVVETWNQNGLQQSIRLNSALWEKTHFYGYSTNWEAEFPELLKSLAEKGTNLDAKNIHDDYRQAVFGTRFDERTTINVFKKERMNFVIDGKKSKTAVGLSAFFQVLTMSNNGDLILNRNHGALYSINIWTMMKEIVADMDRLGAL